MVNAFFITADILRDKCVKYMGYERYITSNLDAFTKQNISFLEVTPSDPSELFDDCGEFDPQYSCLLYTSPSPRD